MQLAAQLTAQLEAVARCQENATRSAKPTFRAEGAQEASSRLGKFQDADWSWGCHHAVGLTSGHCRHFNLRQACVFQSEYSWASTDTAVQTCTAIGFARCPSALMIAPGRAKPSHVFRSRSYPDFE